MYLIIRLSKFFSFVILNYLLIFSSTDIDIEQFEKDLNIVFNSNQFSEMTIFVIISICVVILTFIVKQIFNPFVEIFLMRYYKFSFYFLINILSVSATYIVLRVYGYSRLNLIIYLFLASIFFEIYERIERKFLQILIKKFFIHKFFCTSLKMYINQMKFFLSYFIV